MKFQKGDMVIVIKEDLGSFVGWAVEMSSWVNNGVCKIEHIESFAEEPEPSYLLINATFPGFTYWFPESCLALAEGYVPPTQQELICQKIKAMYQRRKEAGYAF